MHCRDVVKEEMLSKKAHAGCSREVEMLSSTLQVEIQANLHINGPGNIRALMTAAQDDLHKATRAALQATVKLETSVIDLSSPVIKQEHTDRQKEMFLHLSTLKESLWRILVITNSMHD